MTQVKFMDDIVNEYRKQFDTPVLTHYVSNDMSSNYYFLDDNGNDQDDAGNKYYVDQFDLQEYFDDDNEIDADGEYKNTYTDETLESKAQALQELAFVIVGGKL